jgi:signal transduction histidine kinase
MNQVASTPPFAATVAPASLTADPALLTALLDGSPDGLVLTGAEGAIVYTNPSFRRLLADSATMPDNLQLCLPPETWERLSQAKEGQIAPEPQESMLLGAREPDTVVELTFARLSWEGRELRLCQVRDCSARRARQLDAVRSQQHELLGRVSSGIVHETNNIFTAIMGSASLLQMGDHERAAIHTDNILKSSQRGATLLRRLSAFSRSADGALEQIQLAELLAESTAIARDMLGDGGPIAFAADDGLPTLQGDQAQLHQVVITLCTNAREAMPAGGPIMVLAQRRQLTVPEARALGQGARAGDFLVLSVQDRGSGITPENRARLFEPFFTTKQKGKGSGLGLPTALRHVRRHGGFMTVDTEVGRGSCFACYFPVA